MCVYIYIYIYIPYGAFDLCWPRSDEGRRTPWQFAVLRSARQYVLVGCGTMHIFCCQRSPDYQIARCCFILGPRIANHAIVAN